MPFSDDPQPRSSSARRTLTRSKEIPVTTETDEPTRSAPPRRTGTRLGRPPRADRERDRDRDRDISPEVQRRVRQFDNQCDPLSLAEEFADEMVRLETTQSNGDCQIMESVNITRLQKLPLAELVKAADEEGVAGTDQLDRSGLVVQVLKQRIKRTGMMYGEGTLEILPDGFGFLRSSEHHYLSCPDDIYVSPSQIRKFNLRTGSVICGQIRPPKENERYFALLRVQTVNGLDPLVASRRRTFDDLTPLHPNQRIVMDFESEEMSTRVVDMLAPIGFGQRGLIVSPPRAGKTILMQNMARAVLHNYPEAYVIMLLVDERPEEVTDMQRQIKGPRCEVVSSTFDEHPARHVQVADMVLEKTRRLVEGGQDVIVFLDSITRLGRAWNQMCPQSGKLLSGGLDANAMQKPKAFFGSARKVEEGGSLTIIATALIDTGSRMDEVIFEEFKGTGNLEIVLDRALVDRRIWPSMDINRSGTRREEMLFDPEEYQRICLLRRVLATLNPPEAMELLLGKLRKTKSNGEFLMTLDPSRL
jgi:transcription termination factor Rho